MQIEFVKDLSSDLPHIVADPGQLQQVFLNLILNAVDAIYSTSGHQGVITIKTRQSSDKTIKISIADNGKGIDSKSLEYVFKPFFTTKSQGTGLGLAISKRLVEQHNDGTITFKNNPGGKGIIFTLTFPIDEG
jgi:signal transduction histidine kinase